MTIACPQTLVDSRIRIVSSLATGQVLFHSLHPRTKRFVPLVIMTLARGAQMPTVIVVVRITAMLIQATVCILARLLLPGFYHFNVHVRHSLYSLVLNASHVQ